MQTPTDLELARVSNLAAADLQQAAELLADAFDDHPYFMWAFPGDARREANRALFTGALKDGMQNGRVDIARDDRVVGVMISYGPGRYPPTIGRMLQRWREHARIALVSPSGLMRLLATKSYLDALHPHEPHYHVFAIATDRARRGAANRLAENLFAASDAEGVPVYCETQRRDTLEWGIRLGFRVLQENVPMYPGGPQTWTLWREPVRQSAFRFK